MSPACVFDRWNSGRMAMIAVLMFCRTMYEMKYIAQSRINTLVVAGSGDRRAVFSMPRILFDQRMKDDSRVPRLDPGKMGDLVAAGRSRRGQQLALFQRARRRPREAGGVPKSGARPRGDLWSTQTSQPCRNSRSRARRPCTTEFATTAPW